MKIIRPTANSVFDICDSNGVKLLTRLRRGLSHLREHKFNHNFKNTINPCNLEVESVSHYFSRCQNFTQQRKILMNELSNIIPSIRQNDNSCISKLLLYGEKTFDNATNKSILEISIRYIIASKRFEEPLL